jgi:hypothetical protein
MFNARFMKRQIAAAIRDTLDGKRFLSKLEKLPDVHSVMVRSDEITTIVHVKTLRDGMHTYQVTVKELQ